MFLMYFTKLATYFLHGHVTGPCCQLYCSSMECDSLIQSSQRSYLKIGILFLIINKKVSNLAVIINTFTILKGDPCNY